MKAVVVLSAAAIAFASVAAFGQGQFFLNTHDTTAGNVITFDLNGAPATGSDLFMEVSAGPDIAHQTALMPVLPLNRTGAGAGFPDPFSAVYTVPGMTAGQTATVGVQYFQGASSATAILTTGIINVGTIVLTEPPTPPNEVAIGVKTVSIPEPTSFAMFLLGLGGIAFSFSHHHHLISRFRTARSD